MERTFTRVGKGYGYERESIERSINELEWEKFRTDNLPFMQGEAIKQVIKQCNVPLSKIKKMALHGGLDRNSHEAIGFYGLDVDYKNGNAKLYIADDGCEICIVASDFMPV